MNSIKHRIMENMTNEQKTLFLLKIPYINLFKLSKTYERNIILRGGNPKDKKVKIDYDKEYNKEYDNNTGKFNIEIDTQKIKQGLIFGAHQKNDNIFLGCNNKFYYRVERYSTNEGTEYEDKEYKFIDFITIKDKYKGLIDCGSISINIKNKIATITSLGSDSKCLKSKNDVDFKYGDILYQIMLYICKKEKIKRIELTDNSNRKCGDIDLSLDYLKTLTHGFPHYHKYGFKFKYDEDNETLIENYNKYKTDPKITKKKLLSLLKKKNVDEKTIESINKILDKLPNDTQEIKHSLIYGAHHKIDTNFIGCEISIKKIVKLYTLNLLNKENCDMIHKIYIELYKEAGYKFYSTKEFYLNLK